VVGQLDRGADQLEVTTANAPSAWTSAGVQARGWLAYTFRVPTGWSASRTGTLRTPRTCSCRTTTAIRSQTSSLHKSWTATTRSSAKAARHGPSPKSRWTSSNSCIAASVVATHLGWPSSQVKVRPVPSTPTTVLVTSTTRPSGPADPRPQAWPAARPRSVRQVDHPPLSLVFRSS
jgi:hypothetical protein